MIIASADKRAYCHDAVPSGAILDHDRLIPFLSQSIGQQPRPDVGAAAWPERQDELDRPRRPGLRRC
jgi:hypothetical protein